jgi:hypothetical protein
MATYTAGVTYFHGGLLAPGVHPSRDRCTAQAGLEKRRRPSAIEINLTYRGSNRGTVTTLMPSMELTYPAADLFGPAERADPAGGDRSMPARQLAKPPSSAVVDPVSREINLERGKAIKVPLRLQEGFEGEFKVIAADPATGAAYATVKLKTDFHH